MKRILSSPHLGDAATNADKPRSKFSKVHPQEIYCALRNVFIIKSTSESCLKVIFILSSLY